MEKFTIVFPTMWRAPDLFKSALERYSKNNFVGEIIIINNQKEITPNWDILSDPKIRIIDQEKNIGVNPAWNLGVALSTNDKICISNDDIIVDDRVFEKVFYKITSSSGPYGIIYGREDLNQPVATDNSIDFMQWVPGDVIHCFGQFFFIHKSSWIDIPSEYIIYYGDDLIFHYHLQQKKIPHLIYNIKYHTVNSTTCTQPDLIEFIRNRGSIENESFQKEWQPIDLSWIPARQKIKKILIAVPTNKYIEPETFKSIYDLDIPEGYTTEFQFFYGYQIDQIRNLIAEWGKNYDYLFCVDSDIVLPNDCLLKMLAADKDMISGLYIQRFEDKHVLEIYHTDLNQNIVNTPIEWFGSGETVPIAACGFGCVLIKNKVLTTLPYPHFVYRSAIDHNNTFSEDVYFCVNARNAGFSIWADTSITCQHIGRKLFEVKQPKQIEQKPYEVELDRLYGLSHLMPSEHVSYLKNMNIEPKVIYDIGASALHWHVHAKEIWPNSRIISFDAVDEFSYLYDKHNCEYHIGVLSNEEKDVKFYQKILNPGGNSYYKERGDFYTEDDVIIKKTTTLDNIISKNNLPYPDLIKIDVQGAELDVLEGAKECLKHVKDIIIETQHEEYNLGAPGKDIVMKYLIDRGFYLISTVYVNGPDADYHFRKR